MLAGEVAAPFPTVGLDTPVVEAARLLAGQNLPGLIVVDEAGRPWTVLPGTQVLRMAVPAYCQDDPAWARVIDEPQADLLLAGIAGQTVRQCLPEPPHELPVDPDATVLEIAAVMARTRSPLVAVVEEAGGCAVPSPWTGCWTGCWRHERHRVAGGGRVYRRLPAAPRPWSATHPTSSSPAGPGSPLCTARTRRDPRPAALSTHRDRLVDEVTRRRHEQIAAIVRAMPARQRSRLVAALQAFNTAAGEPGTDAVAAPLGWA